MMSLSAAEASRKFKNYLKETFQILKSEGLRLNK